MEMVAAHQVVGSLPPLDMAAAEKRRLVEQSMRDRKGKAKEDTPVPPPEDPSSSEESSSEEESSEEESSSDEDTENEGEPMTETTHQALKAKLDDLNGVTSLPKSESAASLVPPSPSRRIPLEMLDEDEEASGGPILSTNEAPLSVVPQPPMYELPKGEELSLAGEVVSWMRDRRVEAWVEKGKLEEEIKVDMETNPPPDGHMEDGEIAGEEAAMVNGVPESKVKILDGGAMDAKNEAPVALSPSHKRDNPSSSSSKPRFASAGTVVVRAMQSRPGSGRDGWLEEGSDLCWEDRRVLGTVSCSHPLYHLAQLHRLPRPSVRSQAPTTKSASHLLLSHTHLQSR